MEDKANIDLSSLPLQYIAVENTNPGCCLCSEPLLSMSSFHDLIAHLTVLSLSNQTWGFLFMEETHGTQCLFLRFFPMFLFSFPTLYYLGVHLNLIFLCMLSQHHPKPKVRPGLSNSIYICVFVVVHLYLCICICVFIVV